MRLAFATGTAGEFSLNGGLPWGRPIKEDMDHFKRFCDNKVLIMGYKTWVSMPEITKKKYKMLVIFNRKDETYNQFQGLKFFAGDDSQLVSFLGFLRDCEDSLDKKTEHCLIGGASMVETALRNLDIFDSVLYTQVRKVDDTDFNCCTRINHELLSAPDTNFKFQYPHFHQSETYDVIVTIYK